LAKRGFGHFWLQRFGLVILLVAVVVSLANVLSLSVDAEILPLTSGASSSLLGDQAAYQAAADRLLGSSIWNRNKITIDTAKISRQMLAQFPELASASVTLPLLAHRPLIYVQTAEPALVLMASNGSFVLDDNGKALLPAGQLPSLGSLNLPQVTDQSGLHVELNHQVLTTSDVSFVQTVVAQLAAKHFTVSAMTLPAGASELDVHLSGQPYFIKFNLENDDPRQQAGTFLATQAQLQRQNVTPGQYIDVRLDGRAYYQ
jgi:cell division septal protein FtsQ